ncbi:GGDEF domain-containing protein [Duganella violaceipulchra]|uniref:GGDEF domain-containing protein n=1 Tax=Duganella violaceipulchra TaxID=2849652 RepID=A0AA41H994_9BURK|nr:GGDEF domain-containing protein [Duganella violaceicalia]MBV6320612.1 GGDEF domain-containing protein [Duganella violaceicalia]MCP2008679.1 GGDEF domain-containing protein [Duganella violaceicalia]
MDQPLPWADDTPHLTIWCAVLFCCFSALLAAVYLLPPLASLLCVVPLASYLMLGRHMGMVYSIGWSVLGLAVLVLRPGSSSGTLLGTAAAVLGVGLLSHWFEARRAALTAVLRRTASLDPLTGLHNHLYLEAIFSQLTRSQRGKPQSVTMMLVALAPGADDTRRIEAARLIGEVCRASDWAFRFGDDSYCVLVPWVSQVQGQQIADRLLARLNTDARTPARLGLARWPEEAQTLAQLHQITARSLKADYPPDAGTAPRPAA